jgi:hypothetical protein
MGELDDADWAYEEYLERPTLDGGPHVSFSEFTDLVRALRKAARDVAGGQSNEGPEDRAGKTRPAEPAKAKAPDASVPGPAGTPGGPDAPVTTPKIDLVPDLQPDGQPKVGDDDHPVM